MFLPLPLPLLGLEGHTARPVLYVMLGILSQDVQLVPHQLSHLPDPQQLFNNWMSGRHTYESLKHDFIAESTGRPIRIQARFHLRVSDSVVLEQELKIFISNHCLDDAQALGGRDATWGPVLVYINMETHEYFKNNLKWNGTFKCPAYHSLRGI